MRLFDLVVAPPLWLFVLWKARTLRAAPRQDHFMWAMWLLWATSVTIGVPVVRRAIDSAVGMQSFTNLPVHMLSLCAMTALFEFIREATGTRRTTKAWPRWLLLGLAEAGLAAAFFAVPLPDGDTDLVTQTHSSMLQVYWAIFLAYIAYGVTSAVRLCWRYGRHASPGPSRTAMTLLGLASFIGLLYVIHRLVYLAAAVAGWHDTTGVATTTRVLLACTLVLLTAGVTWPSVAERIRSRRLRHDALALRPLWEHLTSVTPEVVLPLPEGLGRDHEFVRYRYLIEIRDAALAVSVHVQRDQEARVRKELTGSGPASTSTSLEAAAEAALLLFAVAAEREGAKPSAAEHPLLREGLDLETEIAWLRRVAAAMSTPAVRAAADALALRSRA